MNSGYLLAVLLMVIMVSGCRQRVSKPPSSAVQNQPGEIFVVGKEGERVKGGGDIDLRDVAGVPQLTVDVHGD